ncbi:hypothetical protein HAX54_005963 [Datura stramonium]|uniref:Uncharacterized protein n=1 Tax=Datura stramonium TaxID=4076 RepID=A0ABS8RHP1_DATST|nr:hypothetical protein [Datura stramonium]
MRADTASTRVGFGTSVLAMSALRFAMLDASKTKTFETCDNWGCCVKVQGEIVSGTDENANNLFGGKIFFPVVKSGRVKEKDLFPGAKFVAFAQLLRNVQKEAASATL